MVIELLPYGRQSISEDDISAVAEVLRGDWLTTGPTVDRFEAAVAELSGTAGAVSCSSGTAALHTAYAAIGVGPGDEVITTPMTFIATASTASMLGATVVFADVDPSTGLIDAEHVAALVTERTKVIAAVDYAGQPCDYDRLRAVADTGAPGRRGIVVLDDAAHSIGGSYHGRPIGAQADVTTFSFFPTKNLTTFEGGAVAATDAALVERAREFHRVGLVRDAHRFEVADQGAWHQEVHEFGLNYRLTDVACALGLSQLTRLAQFKARRAAIYARYSDALADIAGLGLPAQNEDVDPVWHLYPVRIPDGRRREVYERMRTAGIGVQVNYLPVYWHPVYARLGYPRGLCPRAEQFYEAELSLPMFADLGDDDVDRVIDALVTILR